jgi:hypothetical protein
MTNPADLTVHGLGWLHLVGGMAFLLLPGLAATDRWLRGMPLRWLWTPVFSLSLLPLAAILLSYAFDVKVTPTTTMLVALVLSIAIARPRIEALLRRAKQADPSQPQPQTAWRTWPILALVLLMVITVHSLPHLPGPDAESMADAVQAMTHRGLDLWSGRDVPYPVHVDEHVHMARIAEIDRSGQVDIHDPYTGQPPERSLFTITGMRSERGWQVAMAQVHQLTGATLPTLTHFLPAVWAGYLALATWATLRPAPGAIASAAFVAAMPTTVRFMGVGFLVPIGFSMPWLMAVLAVALQARGPGRFAALLLLVTSAFFVHLVAGTLALAIGLIAAVLQPASRAQRAGLVAGLTIPLVWIVPAIYQDFWAEVIRPGVLPFEVHVFAGAGAVLLGLAAAGMFLAFLWPTPETVAHRALGLLALTLLGSAVISVLVDHRNDATYSRLISPLFLALASLAGLTLGKATQWLGSLPVPGRTQIAAVAGLLTCTAALAVPIQSHLNTPYYQVFDDRSWQQAAIFAQSGANASHTFLSHPWQAPVYNAMTGARPWTVLLPGSAPAREHDYIHYLRSNGANPAWFEARSIHYVVAPIAPNATHQVLGPGVFLLG